MHINRGLQDDITHVANVLTVDSDSFERAMVISRLSSDKGLRIMYASDKWPDYQWNLKWSRRKLMVYPQRLKCFVIFMAN